MPINQFCDSCENKKFIIKTAGKFIMFDACRRCDPATASHRFNECFKLNSEKISSKANLDLKSMGYTDEVCAVYKEFLAIQRKEKNKEEIEKILENPDEYHLVRALEIGQVAAMHMVTRNPIFVGDLKNDRQKYVKISKLDGSEIDIPLVREFKGWGNTKISVNGPMLDENDKKIYYACLKIFHENGSKGLYFKTNFSEIWRHMGNSTKLSVIHIDRIKRSLERLRSTTISVKTSDLSAYWSGGFFSGLEYVDNATKSYVLLTLNKDCIPIYRNGEFTPIKTELLYSLKSYARRMLEFLVSHSDPCRVMSLDKWQAVLGAENLSKVDFKKRIKAALKEQIDASILSADSRIEKDLVYTTVNLDYMPQDRNQLI